jgi:hypothetical protein
MIDGRHARLRSGHASRFLSSLCQTSLSYPGKLRAAAAFAGIAACGITAPALGQLAAPVYVTGGATATITVTFTAAPPAGSTVSCSLSLISSDPRGPSDTNSTSAPVSGSSAICQITMHFNWRLTSGSSDTMTIAYSVAGPVQTSSGLVNIIPMPASGTQLNLNIPVTQ